MKKNTNLSVTCLLLLTVLVITSCSSTPSYSSLPETNPITASFVGSWVSNDAYVSESYGSVKSVKGRQFYTFYEDGTGEILDYNGSLLTNRRVFRFRATDTLIGFQFLKGTVFTNGGSFSRPYSFSSDKRSITFPDAPYGIGSFAAFSMQKATPPPLPPPPPLPAPEPTPAGSINNAGIIFYSYDGTGYVYYDNAIFYRCSDGKPVGYVESGAIYGFNGTALGFLERSYIHDLNGYPIGTTYSNKLGMDDKDKKPVNKAAKQDLPAKQTRVPVKKPSLRDMYFGGVLQDIFK